MDVLVVVRAGERRTGDLLAAAAELAGEPPLVVHSGADAEVALRSRGRDVLVVDPDVAPPALAERIAAERERAVPVVCWLGSRSSGRVAALLDAGADEVLDPSMSGAELGARLRRAARSGAGRVTARPAVLGELRVDARLRTATWGERPLELTRREAEVLQVLVAAGGHPVPREVVYRHVWRWAMPRGDRAVDVNVKRIRAKLAAAGVPVEIATRSGVGYAVRVGELDPVVTGL